MRPETRWYWYAQAYAVSTAFLMMIFMAALRRELHAWPFALIFSTIMWNVGMERYAYAMYRWRTERDARLEIKGVPSSMDDDGELERKEETT